MNKEIVKLLGEIGAKKATAEEKERAIKAFQARKYPGRCELPMNTRTAQKVLDRIAREKLTGKQPDFEALEERAEKQIDSNEAKIAELKALLASMGK